MLIFDNQFQKNDSTATFTEILSPYDKRVVGKFVKPNQSHVELALSLAVESFSNIMKKMPAWKRAEVLYKVSEFIKRDHELLSQTIAAEGGKPLKDARIEVTRAVNTVKMSGDAALTLNGEQLSMDRAAGSENHLAFTVRQGMGVVLAISAFNHPVNLICHQVATAFAAGNCVIVKPASQTPLSCLKICSYFVEAGIDEGIIIALPIAGAETEKIISDCRIKFVSFIGSAEVGWRIPKLIAPGTGYALEHGGTAVAVVESSADLEFASTSIVKGGFYHAGQVCVSTQNVFVKSDIFDELLKKIISKTATLITGDPNDEKTDVGPIINSWEHNRILSLIDEALSMGAILELGGNPLSESCIAPTILSNTNYNMQVMKSEIFGPVININRYNKLDDVIELCNRTPFSFQNAIYTKDIDAAFKFAREIDSKAVIINDSTAFRVDWMPFGGAKESGFRVGGVKYSVEDVSEEKLIVIRMHNYDA